MREEHKLYIEYPEFLQYTNELTQIIKDSKWYFKSILCPGGSGAILGTYLSYRFIKPIIYINMKSLPVMGISGYLQEPILVVDTIVTTGGHLKACNELLDTHKFEHRSAAIFVRGDKANLNPDWYLKKVRQPVIFHYEGPGFEE